MNSPRLLTGRSAAALALGVLARAWPRARWQYARLGAVLLQWGAQLMVSGLILSGA
ncbi:hypothetical protein [Streptomyces chromofuscus]|uniref:Uncharacterized protein n=1 Tax=Streptomyces chromofuscus TaxID=42881 RepID=A0A7M2T436_STRCW|nr:hypothetical protein [Streptomyces chromofuscus]QOV42655.1 hypothetical protein IPT68_22945 [Streptomyces chromofuscus]